MDSTEKKSDRPGGRLDHGHDRRGQRTSTYRSWATMIQRCTNINTTHFDRYGGRGIYVCSRWSGEGGFANFLEDMGERPEGTTLDRRDNDGPYEPSNCRWVTRKEQAQNRSRAAYYDRGHQQSVCHPGRLHRAHGLCASCYQIIKNGNIPGALRGSEHEPRLRELLAERAAKERKARCHPDRKYYARDMCGTCYVPFKEGVVPLAIRGTDFEAEVLVMLAERAKRKN